MSQNTMVIYLKNPNIKEWLAKKADNKVGKKSLSAIVADILEQEYKLDTQKNSLLSLFGAGKKVPDSDWQEWEKALEQVQQSKVSKAEGHYKDLFKDID